MDRNMRHSTYPNSGPRSLPPHHSMTNGGGLGPKSRHISRRYSPPVEHHNHHQYHHFNNNNNNIQTTTINTQPVSTTPQSHQDDIIDFIYESWNKVTRDVERGCEETKYYQEITPRHLANFRPFNLEEWWVRRVETVKIQTHHS